jgi:hypothetical protein
VTNPNYWYVQKHMKRFHRDHFRKNQLIRSGHDPEKTEWEIMRDLGYDRIWDCGHHRYLWSR